MAYARGTNMGYKGEMLGLNDGQYKWTPIGEVIDHLNNDIGLIQEFDLPVEPLAGMDARAAQLYEKEREFWKVCWNEKFGQITVMPKKTFTNFQVKAMTVPFLEKVEEAFGSGKVLFKDREDHMSYDITLALDETITPQDGESLYWGWKLGTKHNGHGSLNAEWWTIRKVCVNGNLWGEMATAKGHPAKISLIHTGEMEVREAEMMQFIQDVEYGHKTIQEYIDAAIQTKFEMDRARMNAFLTGKAYGFSQKFTDRILDQYEHTDDNAGNWYGFIQSVTWNAHELYDAKTEFKVLNKVQDMFARPGWMPALKTVEALPVA